MFLLVRVVLLAASFASLGFCQDLILEPCGGDGVFEIVENQPTKLVCGASNTLLNSTSYRPRTIDWGFSMAYSRETITVIECDTRNYSPGNCYIFPRLAIFGSVDIGGLSDLVSATLLNTTASELTVSANRSSEVNLPTFFSRRGLNDTRILNHIQTVSCSVGGKSRSCGLDMIQFPQKVTCTWTYNTDTSQNWTVSATCDVSKIYSFKGRYSCRMYSKTKQGTSVPSALGSSVAMVTTPAADGYDVSGSCSMTSSLPSSDGTYVFFIEVTPGRLKHNVTFVGSSQIRKPSGSTLTIICPSHVIEGKDVTCMCTSDDVGVPAGHVQWSAPAGQGQGGVSGSDSLTLTNVQRNSPEVKNMQCQLTWNGETVATANHTIDVWWQPSIPRHTCPSNVTEGSGVTCECVTGTDGGNPKVTVLWAERRNSTLALTSVSRADNGRNFTCQATWNGQTHSLVYSLSVVYKPTTARLTHTCPAYVTEGSTLDCSCVTDDAGNPPATLYWNMTSPRTERLTRHDVQRSDEGMTFACQMAWQGSVMTSTLYTLLVIPDSEAAHSKGIQKGVGIGLGVGVALVVIAVVVVVVFLWRRDWVLPCTHSVGVPRPAKREELEDVIILQQPDTDGQNSADQQPPGVPALQEVSSHYDRVDVSNIGLVNHYEALAVNPNPPSAPNTPGKRNKKKKVKSHRGHDNKGMAVGGEKGSAAETPGEAYENVEMPRRQQASGQGHGKYKNLKKTTKAADADSAVYGNVSN